MMLTEYNEEETMNMFRAEGRAEGRIAAFAEMVHKGVLNITEAAEMAGISEAAFKKMVVVENMI